MTDKKLFDLPATPRERVFTLETYHGNRIAVKLMKLLKRDKIYKVKKADSLNGLTIFEISIITVEEKKEAFNLLVNEIISYIPDHFPQNYLFCSGSFKLGFIYSFYLQDEPVENCRHFSHKIKEINKNSVLPETQILTK